MEDKQHPSPEILKINFDIDFIRGGDTIVTPASCHYVMAGVAPHPQYHVSPCD